MLDNRKKAISPVIGSVMLIMLTVMAIGIIASIVIPMVRDNLEGGASCFELRDHLEVRSSRENSCHNDTETRVMIKREFDNVSIEGIMVSLKTDGGGEKPFKITKDSSDGVKMLNSTGGRVEARVLEPGEAKTYVFSGYDSDTVEIAPIASSGKTCEEQNYNLPECL